MSDTENLPRETGSEKITTCPVCGREQSAVETPYGSLVAEPCTHGEKASADEDPLASQKAAAESAKAKTKHVAGQPAPVPVDGEVDLQA